MKLKLAQIYSGKPTFVFSFLHYTNFDENMKAALYLSKKSVIILGSHFNFIIIVETLLFPVPNEKCMFFVRAGAEIHKNLLSTRVRQLFAHFSHSKGREINAFWSRKGFPQVNLDLFVPLHQL